MGAITHPERPRQTESSTIYHIPQQSISHAQPPLLQYMQQKTIHHIPTQESIQQPVISYTPQQSISHTPQYSILNSKLYLIHRNKNKNLYNSCLTHNICYYPQYNIQSYQTHTHTHTHTHT